MEPYPKTPQCEYGPGCAEENINSSPTGRFAVDEPMRKSIAPDLVHVEAHKYNGGVKDGGRQLETDGTADASSGGSDNLLAEIESSSGPLKAVHDLEEALWLVQEELAEEQRLRAEERKHYAIFQDEYLRLQEESSINSKRITAAEVSAQAARSLAIDAVEDKEYFARLLYQTQTQLHCLTAVVEDMMPRLKTKLSEVIEQGNTIVALLASRWPEAGLRKQIEALGIAEQPLSRWALFHALKTKEIPFSGSATQGVLDVCMSCPSSFQELKPTENFLESAVSKSPRTARRVTSTLCSVEETAETIEEIQKCRDQVESVNETEGQGRTSKLRIGTVDDATHLLPLHLRRQIGGLPPSRMSSVNSAALEKRGDSKRHAEATSISRDGSKLVSRPSSVATRSRGQTAADRRMKPSDSTGQVTPSGARHALPPLPVGKIVLHGTSGLASRDSHRTHRVQTAFTKNSARGETSSCKKESSAAAPLASSRRYIARQTRQCKEDHGLKPHDTEDYTSSPASLSLNSRRSVTQRRTSLDRGGASVHLHTSGNLRATQPPSLTGSLPNSGLPSRMTCGTVLPTCKEFTRRLPVSSSAKERKEQKRDARLFQDLTLLAPKEASVLSQAQSDADIPDGLQLQTSTSPSSLPVLHRQSIAHDEELGPMSDSSAGIVAPLVAVGRNENLEGVSGSGKIPQRTDITTPADRQHLGSSGARVLCITTQGREPKGLTQGSSGSEPKGSTQGSTGGEPKDRTQGSCGGEPKDSTNHAEAAAPQNHNNEIRQKPALPSHDPGNWNMNVTPHFQGTNGGDRQPVASLRCQIDSSKGGASRDTSARPTQAEQHRHMHQPQLRPSAAPHIQGSSLDLSRQQGVDVVRGVCNAPHFIPCGVTRGTLPLQPQQFEVRAAQQPDRQWLPGIRYEMPRRSSLPESGSQGLLIYGNNMFVQHQQAVVGQEFRGGLPWPIPKMVQRPVFAPRNPISQSFQQPTSFQQHCVSIPQQYLQSQPHQLQRVIPNQQQAPLANMHYKTRNIGSDFITGQQQHMGIPMPGEWRSK
ncbi:uncharacterized protein EMH_0022130 [Eimeria mitis]|uniref:Uncharacterized protein n=1 Tax=Eimeria mitis TaxID=44415 RepID=U6K158_9EIME|nr:uncharacterized protein EMH_0022130 [Eimeria mitis]CDJ29503.1 hypothetical protein, conserved [Eimeria mitis]